MTDGRHRVAHHDVDAYYAYLGASGNKRTHRFD
jgi:hypothetical protein